MTINGSIRKAGLIVAFILASAVLPATAAPRDDAQEVDRMRAAMTVNAEKAIAKQGGSRILFKVDAGALREMTVTEIRDDLYRILREGRVPFAALAVREAGVEVRIAEAKDQQRVVSKLVPSTEAPPSRAATVGSDGLIRITPTDFGFAERLRGLVRQSIEMIEQRLRNGGIGQAAAQPDGSDGIRVLLPGVTDPERVTAMFSKKARIGFRLVDDSMTAAEALKGPAPPASDVLYDFKTRTPYLLLKEIAMEGDDIIDAAPGFDSRSNQPIASFRFNARGTRRFAQITGDNVGRPFAIVFDDQVLSVSVIREPIQGGSGVISGNFTIEEANTVAMLLRSGALPGRLSVVDQQVVGPAANGGKQ